MKNLTELFKDLESEIQKKLSQLIETHGVESKFSSEMVLKIEDGDLMYNIVGNSVYTLEVSQYALIGNDGNTYSHQGIEIEKLCEILDSFNK